MCRNEPPLDISSIPDAVLVVGRDGSIVSANGHAERLFGFGRGKLVGVSIEELVPERYRQQHQQLREGFSADPGVRPMGSGRELSAVRSDGHEFPVEIAIGPSESGESASSLWCATLPSRWRRGSN